MPHALGVGGHLGVVENREDLFGANDDVVFAVDVDFGAAVLAVQNGLTDLNVHRCELAAIEALAGAYGEDGAALRLLLRGVGKNDASRRGLLLGGGFDDDSIVQGL